MTEGRVSSSSRLEEGPVGDGAPEMGESVYRKPTSSPRRKNQHLESAIFTELLHQITSVSAQLGHPMPHPPHRFWRGGGRRDGLGQRELEEGGFLHWKRVCNFIITALNWPRLENLR